MRISKKIITIIISTVILLMISINKSNASTKGVITDISVRLREEASTSSKILTFVTQDDEVEVIEKDGDWYKIKYKNYTGYVSGEYIDIENESELDDNKTEENTSNNGEEQDSSSNEEESSENQEDNNENSNSEEIKDDENSIKECKLSKDKKILILPNINSSIIYTVKEDVKIEIIERLDKWSYINVQGTRGWIRNDLIEEIADTDAEEKNEETEPSSEKSEEETVGYIKYDTVNLREKPSTTSKVLAKLSLNTEVKIKKSYNDSWYEVEVDGNTGYISKDLISNEKQAEEEKSDTETTSRSDTTRVEEVAQEVAEETNKKEEEKSVSTTNNNQDTNKITGEDIVEYAKTFLGCKYKYGGTSPSGFDCSGLTYYVYKHFGYKINRASYAQAKNGVYVSKSNLQKGDLVFFRKLGTTGDTIGHVGIYIGDDKFIEASDYSTGVIISSLSKKNYADRYITARRIL